MKNYDKLQEAVDKAEKNLEEAKSEFEKCSRQKSISPEEIVEEMTRMAQCQDFEAHSPKEMGVTLVRNIFINRSAKEQQWKDEQRDY